MTRLRGVYGAASILKTRTSRKTTFRIASKSILNPIRSSSPTLFDFSFGTDKQYSTLFTCFLCNHEGADCVVFRHHPVPGGEYYDFITAIDYKTISTNAQWLHIAISYSSNPPPPVLDSESPIMTFYLNGIIALQCRLARLKVATKAEDLKFSFGGSAGGAGYSYFNGAMNDLRVYKDYLTWENVRTIMHEAM